MHEAAQTSTTSKVGSKEHDKLEKLPLEIEYYSIEYDRIGFFQVFAYSYCYIGLLTGPYFKYRTYVDWLSSSSNAMSGGDLAKLMWQRGKATPIFIAIFLLLSKFITFQVKNKTLICHRACLYFN